MSSSSGASTSIKGPSSLDSFSSLSVISRALNDKNTRLAARVE